MIKTLDSSFGEDPWDNRITQVLKSQKKFLCENYSCSEHNVGFMSKEELIEHTVRMLQAGVFLS